MRATLFLAVVLATAIPTIPSSAVAPLPPESSFYRIAGTAYASSFGTLALAMDPLLVVCSLGAAEGTLEGTLVQQADEPEALLVWRWMNAGLPCGTAHVCELQGDPKEGWVGDCGEPIFLEWLSLRRSPWDAAFLFQFHRYNVIGDGIWVWAWPVEVTPA